MSESRMKDIEQQLAFLQWSKLRNERAIKSSLEFERTKKERDTFMKVKIDASDRKQWKGAVINDELTKPLEFNDHQKWVVTYKRGRSSKGVQSPVQMWGCKYPPNTPQASALMTQARLRQHKDERSQSPTNNNIPPSTRTAP